MNPISKALLWLTIANIVCYLVIIGVGSYFLVQNRERAREGQQAKAAACALKTDLTDRRASSEKDLARQWAYLKKHPHGIGPFSRADFLIAINKVKLDIHNQTRTIHSLAKANCG